MPSFEEAKREYEEIIKQLSDPELISDWEKFEDISRRKKELEKIVDKKKEIDDTRKQIEENKSILNSREDEELVSLAEADILHLEERIKKLELELNDILKEKKPSSDYNSVIMEIRAGAGGDEAALFAGNLSRMYLKYAALQGWKQKTLDSHQTEIGGYKEIVFEIKGKDVYFKMKYEGGVHRVQRIPETEKQGRVHTSTATVAVLPKPKPREINIRADQLRIDVFRSSGAGGQNVQKRETAVRITHLPTGIAVASQTERNQLQNKENAMAILSAKLLEKKEEEEHSKMAGNRKSQIGQAKRAEKIRTYNFPQDRLTDHRIKKSWHNLEEIMEGKIDGMIETLSESIKNEE